MLGIKKESLISADCQSIDLLNTLWNSIAASLLKNKEQTERLSHKGLTYDVTIIPMTTDNEVQRISVSFRDITSYVRLEHQFSKRNKELVVANILTSAFISSGNLETVYNELLETVLLVCGVKMGWVILKQNGNYELTAVQGISNGFREKVSSGAFDTMYSKVLGFEAPFYIIDAKFEEMPEPMSSEGLVFFAAVPLRVGSDILGLVVMTSRAEVEFEFDAASLFSLIGNTLSLIAEKILLFQKTQKLAITDPLTNLYNMRHFYGILEQEVLRAERYGNPFSVVLFDIDNFKKLNDTFGHQAGDNVLKNVSENMKKTLRKTDTLARFGGEEFIALLPNTETDEAMHMAERLKASAEQPINIDNQAVRITLSGGVASFPRDAKKVKDILYASDMAMYQAKTAGKNQIKCYTEKP